MSPERSRIVSSATRRSAGLSIRNITAGWGRRPVLRDVSLRLRAGERVALLGPNGAGKTTLFDVIAGRLPARSGTVSLGTRSLNELPPHLRARLGLGYVPQEPTVFPDLSVRANIEAGAQSPAALRGTESRPQGRFGPRAARTGEAAVDAVLKHWNLTGIQSRQAGVLSGGERRRVEVARALIAAPSILLLDEPFAGLDPEGRDALSEGLLALPRGESLLVTDHAHEDVLKVCDRAILLVDGQVVFDGPSSEVVGTSSLYRRPAGA